MYVTLSVEVIQTDINKVGVFVNDSWRRKWISLCIHHQSHCRKNSFSWGTGSWNGQYCFGEQWQPGVDIFLWIPSSQNIVRYNRQASIQLNFSITCACKIDMFWQQVLFAFFHGTGEWANSLVDAASFNPLKLLFACSCCAPVYLSIAGDSKWKIAVSWPIKKSWTTVELR